MYILARMFANRMSAVEGHVKEEVCRNEVFKSFGFSPSRFHLLVEISSGPRLFVLCKNLPFYTCTHFCTPTQERLQLIEQHVSASARLRYQICFLLGDIAEIRIASLPSHSICKRQTCNRLSYCITPTARRSTLPTPLPLSSQSDSPRPSASPPSASLQKASRVPPELGES